MQQGGGVRVLTELETQIKDSKFKNNNAGVGSAAVIYLSRGKHLILENQFLHNQTPAVASAANASAYPHIIGNYIEANNLSNSNRPQINMGPTGAQNDTIRIENNIIIGDRNTTKVGGISVAALVGGKIRAKITGNEIRDNRYGIYIAGTEVWAEITDNQIEDNDTEGQPMLGGSGINLFTQNPTQYEVYVFDNQIRRNLWGITLQNDASVFLGDDDKPGNNVFSENSNSGEIYALYNNTSNQIMAKYNCWVENENISLEDAEAVIFHQVDNPDLGEVIFDPVSCAILNVEDVIFSDVKIFPNPSSEVLNLHGVAEFNSAVIYDMMGRKLLSVKLQGDTQKINLNLRKGNYLLYLEGKSHQQIHKLLVK